MEEGEAEPSAPGMNRAAADMAQFKRLIRPILDGQTATCVAAIDRACDHLEESFTRQLAQVQSMVTRLTDQVGALSRSDEETCDLGIIDPLYGRHLFAAGAYPGVLRRHLIMPIHPPKIVHLSSIFERLREVEPAADVLWTLVTTSRSERETLEAYIKTMKPFVPVAMEVVSAIELCELLNFEALKANLRQDANGSIINVKKLLAIYRAIDLGAEEVCCVDSDIIFLQSPTILFDRARENFKKRVFFAAGCPNDNVRRILEVSIDYLQPEDAVLVRSIMGENRFSWFFDAPYYPHEACAKFFSYIQKRHGGLERALGQLSWHSFDHILFVNFLVRRGEFRIVDVSSIVRPGVLTDELSLSELATIHASNGYLPVWAPLFSILDEVDHDAARDFVIAFHVDRIKSTI